MLFWGRGPKYLQEQHAPLIFLCFLFYTSTNAAAFFYSIYLFDLLKQERPFPLSFSTHCSSILGKCFCIQRRVLFKEPSFSGCPSQGQKKISHRSNFLQFQGKEEGKNNLKIKTKQQLFERALQLNFEACCFRLEVSTNLHSIPWTTLCSYCFLHSCQEKKNIIRLFCLMNLFQIVEEMEIKKLMVAKAVRLISL